MRKRLLAWVLGFVGGAILFVLAFAAGQRAVASSNTPGSAADPVVSKSYVDQYAVWQIVNVQAGWRLNAGASAEIVLRAGKATIVAGAGGGLSNLTVGKDLKQGEAVPSNNLLLSARDDGRGLKAATNLVLLVRGPYTLTPPPPK